MARQDNIDLGLEVIEMLRGEFDNVSLSLQDIADVCGCTWQAIQQYQQRALGKLREEMARRDAGVHGISKLQPIPTHAKRITR